jgi:GT2 family glycosyltransferase
MNVTVVIPVHNELHFTRRCLESLNACGCGDGMIVVVDNASTDGTAGFLAGRPALRVVTNAENRACAAAWNQGFQAGTTKWTMFLNNDTVVSPGWLEGLAAFAEAEGVDIVSPAMSEGELNYDLPRHAREFTARMKGVSRRGAAWGAAFMVSRRVFEAIGGFDENFRRGGNEDDDFFLRARRAGFRLAVTGGAYIHHFGGTTQNAIIAKHGRRREETIGYFRKKWRLHWVKRRWLRFRRQTTDAWWRWNEQLRHGHTLREHRKDGKLSRR